MCIQTHLMSKNLYSHIIKSHFIRQNLGTKPQKYHYTLLCALKLKITSSARYLLNYMYSISSHMLLTSSIPRKAAYNQHETYP